MELLYSDILPLCAEEGQRTIADCFFEEASKADSIQIAVGYISKASLMELDSFATSSGGKKILLIIGMYYIEGIPESTYRTALEINKKWTAAGIGEIRIVKPFKYHGKMYSFFHNGMAQSAIIGSANLGVLKLEASNRRQYETAVFTTAPEEITQVSDLTAKLAEPCCSVNISEALGIPIIREPNTSLTGVDTVEQIPMAEVSLYQRHKTNTSFVLPLKVPSFSERFMDDGKHYTKSNLNVSYAAPRNAHKARDWYETQFTVSKKITTQEGYPEKNVPFFVVTDDGYTFKVHTTSDGNKQFSAVGDELILGRWVKGRLAAAGLVTPVNNTKLDTQRLGMITKEMLAEYGCDTLVLTKTMQHKEDDDGAVLDVWVLSFEAGETKAEDEE